MIVTLSLLCAIVGLMFSAKAKKTFDKGLSEADSYRMVMEFNKSKRMRKHSTMLLLMSIILFVIYLSQLLININKQ